MKKFILIFLLMATVVWASDAILHGTLLKLTPQGLPGTCTTGDIRFSNSTNKVSSCNGSANWETSNTTPPIVGFTYTNSTSRAYTANNPIQYDTGITDPTGMVTNSASWHATIATGKNGAWMICAMFETTGDQGGGHFYLYVNGGLRREINDHTDGGSSTKPKIEGCLVEYLNAGDYFDVRFDGSNTQAADTVRNRISGFGPVYQ